MSSRVGVNLRASAYLHQGDRKYMEDEFQVAYQRTSDKKDIEYAFFGIFDGHGGKEAANFAKDNLMDEIVSLRAFWSDDDEDVLAAIKEGFLQTHLAMWKELDRWPRTASGWPSTSGTTASVAFIRRQKMYIGHVGDSGIVLGCEEPNGAWRGEQLTQDHKPENIKEKTRIVKSGGKVINKSGVPRVVWNRPKSGHQGPVRRSTPMDEIPFLAVARSLGDLWSYNARNDQFVVSPEPDIYVLPIDIKRHRCLIFGTDGLWNMLTPDNSVSLAHSAEKNNEKHYLGIPTSCGKQRLWVNPSKSIVAGALGRYLKLNLRADNTSAVTVFLDPPGRPKREVLLQQKGLKKGTSPMKPASMRPPGDGDRSSREATVKVHVYNQPQPFRPEGCRGVLRIKERLPEKWQSSDGQDNTPMEYGDDHQGSGEDISQEDGCEGTSNDGVLEERSNESGTTKVGCSECGCASTHAVPTAVPNISNEDDHVNHRSQSIPDKLVPSLPPPLDRVPAMKMENALLSPENSRPEGSVNSYGNRSSGTRSVRDYIKMISVNSTNSPVNDSNSSRKSKLVRVKPFVLPAAVETEQVDTLRKTRSHLNLSPSIEGQTKEEQHTVIPVNNNNEWKNHKEEKSASTSDTENKVLSISPVKADIPLEPVVNVGNAERRDQNDVRIAPKRKRGVDLESVRVEEPSPKSARVHTRSHTWSHKAMVTRSQDRTRHRTSIFPRK
ncbi:Protein phosphatase 1D [Halocaridina rubra]|uniref:Protein phosphatase 1D n=1 Tax=Halocaridina rubra TaxID=373956 RepID=A0AAN8ZY64_HALRR